MARLQDFQNVTPTSSDKILIVQSQGQGLAPHTIKLDSANPTGTGSLSLNRKANTTVGGYSVAEGYNCEASNNQCHAEGYNTKASGQRSHAEGEATVASGSHAHAENASNTASGDRTHAEGSGTTASGYASHAENQNTTASGQDSHAEGLGTIANHAMQHVFGLYNVADTSTAAATSRGNYVEIVGNGENSANRSNARTLDWQGNEVLAGDLTIKGNMSVYDNLNGTVTTQTVDGITWTIVKQGRVYDMFAIIPVQTTTPVMWGNLYVYRNTTPSYSLPVSLTKKISDLSFGTGNTAFWTVYYTDISTRFDSSTTADVIRPTAAGGSSVDVYKHIRGYV